MIKNEFMNCTNCNLGFTSSRVFDITNQQLLLLQQQQQNNYNTKRKLDNFKINNNYYLKKEQPSSSCSSTNENRNNYFLRNIDSSLSSTNTNNKMTNSYYSKVFINSKMKQFEQKSKSTFNIQQQLQPVVQSNSFSSSKKLMKLNSGAILNSLADYNLSNLEDKMLQLDIGYIKQKQKTTEMFKNVSFDSLNNLKNRKINKKFNNDQFEAYRLEQDKEPEEIPKQSYENKQVEPKKKKTNRHHHHRSKRHNNKKETSTNAINKSNDIVLEQINQDSLSAFDFSNTDEFWEDDIVTNSELIGTDALFHIHSSCRDSPISHFISIDIEDDSI